MGYYYDFLIVSLQIKAVYISFLTVDKPNDVYNYLSGITSTKAFLCAELLTQTIVINKGY